MPSARPKRLIACVVLSALCWHAHGTGRAEEPPDVRDLLKQMQAQLDSQKAEITRLRGELDRTRQTEAELVKRLNAVSPAVYQPPPSSAPPAAPPPARSGAVGPPPGGAPNSPAQPEPASGAGVAQPVPSVPRAGSLSVGPEPIEETLPEPFSAREGAIGVGPGTSGAIPEEVTPTALDRLLRGPGPAGYDRAFFIRNLNGPEILYFNFKSQNWYDHIATNPNNPPLGSTPLTPRQNSGTDTIRFRREELHFFGNITDHIGYKIMIDPARAIAIDESASQNNRILQDVFITYTPKLWLGFRFGQFRVPQTMEGFWQDSGNLDFPEETLMTRSFGDVRDAGAIVLGKPFDGIIEYYAGIFNGSRQNRLRDENNQKDLREWVAIHPLAQFISEQVRANQMALKQDPSANPAPPMWKELMFGVSRRDGVEGSDLFGRYHGDATNVFGDIEYGKWVLRGEWSQGRGLNARSVSFDPNPVLLNDLLLRQAQGWYVTLGYNLNKRWRPIIRYEEYRRDVSEPNNMVRITTLGLNYYITGADDFNRIGAHRMLIQAAYNFDRSQANSHYFVGDEFTTNFQVSF